eukprot:TRINITY_DN33432_c0_g1_i1.p1 TRINITY_DN33432_c0_g1~~TRINITY_DN33432_c0_g1_i1.p1  ORF type:complete len:1356 (-),score=350.11 TRINITY_DN33432_c0_g1_i1:110-4177(-)
MDTLASNEETVIRVEAAAEERAEDEEDLVANNREFFVEADEVKEALRKAVQPDLELKACRVLCERVSEIWTQYQEQPGLLDPHLEEMVGILIGALSTAVHGNSTAPVKKLPNLHLLSSLLYLLTTVRGYKTVSRLFPHEAADLEPCLEAAEAEAALASTDTWSTLYCVTLWLGMVLLTPFDLKSIDSGGSKNLATRILELGQKGLRSTSRTRDASAWMLAKYFTRPDVTSAGALQNFQGWTSGVWADVAAPADSAGEGVGADAPVSAVSSSFVRCGALQAWSQTLKAAPRAVLSSLWKEVLDMALKGPSGHGGADFKASSLLRKLRVKVTCRATLVALPPRLAAWRYQRGARSLLLNFAQATGDTSIQMFSNTGGGADASSGSAFKPPTRDDDAAAKQEDGADDEEDVPEEVEDVIELLLTSLADADTVVRWAAAKGVGRVTNRLSRDFGDQVLESLLERCFSFRETDKAWHGGCLGLAELTRRGLLLPERLDAVVPLVCKALHYEQVSGNVVSGSHVRDAACYVCWAFARAYAPDVLQPYVDSLATALIQVAVFDREINCRRAAAAAVQEHVGRQGTFPDGIDVVTCADYWTLSKRRNAYLNVAPELASLGAYRRSLMEHLVDKKLLHQDAQIRILASQALAKLGEDTSEETVTYLNDEVLPKLLKRALESGSNAVGGGSAATSASAPSAVTVQARHGAVIGVAAVVSVLQEKTTDANQTAVRNLVPGLEKARAYRGRGGEVIRQACCQLIACVSAAKGWAFKEATCIRYLQTVDECGRHTTDSIQAAAASALQDLSKLRFSPELNSKCVDNYTAGLRKPDETVCARRGYALSLGALPPPAHTARVKDLLEALCREIRGEDLPGGKDQEDPQVRQYAVVSLGRVLLGGSACPGQEGVAPVSGDDLAAAVAALEAAMGDYAMDRRGDVGSWVRETAMEVIAALLDAQRTGVEGGPVLASPEVTTKLVGLLLQQAMEKIDRLRERAFMLLSHVLLNVESGGSSSSSSRPSPAGLVQLAYRRICHSEPYDLLCPGPSGTSSSSTSPPGGTSCKGSAAWPPSEAAAIAEALRQVDVHTVANAEINEARRANAAGNTFEALVPLLRYDCYRAAIARGLVVSVGGITESTARAGRKALLKQLEEVGCATAQQFTDELLQIFERLDPKDSDAEGKRLLPPLCTMAAMLLTEGIFPERSAQALFDAALRAVRSSRDITRIRSAVGVFVGLLQYPGALRRKSMSMLLQFLGGSFPTVRQETAKRLYIKLIGEEGAFDLAEDVASLGGDAVVPPDKLAEVMELISITPWGTDNDEVLAEALREVYTKTGMPLPAGGRSLLAPKKPKETKPRENQYADLVRDMHY